MKYYIFTYRDGSGGGKRYIRAETFDDAWKRLKQFLNQYHPFRKYHIELEDIMPG